MLTQTLKGFRDFLPQQKRLRDSVIQTIQEVFELFGFEPLETPALEYDEVLAGKYGDEGEKLRYNFIDHGGRKVGLRYDLTIPWARVVSQYRSKLVFPFKRYQIQPVWRAENTQKGRYREFYQCDFDTAGSASPLADAEIPTIYSQVLERLGFRNFFIHCNSRQSLLSLLKKCRVPEDLNNTVLATLDKLEKIGEAEMLLELNKNGIDHKTSQDLLTKIKGAEPDQELANIMDQSLKLGVKKSHLKFSPTLVRGMDYYTGPIFEAVIEDSGIGSVGGAGRYDDLIERFAGVKIPATGGSIGLERIIDILSGVEKPRGPKTKVLLTLFPDLLATDQTLELAQKLRSGGINCEVYPDADAKISRQLDYANKKEMIFAIFIGEKEKTSRTVSIKNLSTGEQKELTTEDLILLLKSSGL